MLRTSTAVVATVLALVAALVRAPSASAHAGDGRTAAAAHDWGSPTARDEFEGHAVDRSRWTLYAGAGNAGAGRRDPAQVRESGGVVTVTGTSNGTTGGMNDRTAHRYGRWETRMRVGPGGDRRYHPVLLLWPTTVSWPQGGEIDYAETTAASSDVFSFLHYGKDNQQTYGFGDVDLTRWHDYAVQWTPAGVTTYVDGVAIFHDSVASHQPPGPMHASIQLDWVPDGTSPTRQSTMQVAWQRYYPV